MAKKVNKGKRGKDKYYHLAKEQGYRARSAFKLIQLNKKYDFLAKAHTLIDLCAAPGGWLQVAAKYMPSGSTIVGVDLMPIQAIRGVITHKEDITTPACRTLLKKDLPGQKADVVLHDGAPNVGQNWAKDAFGQSELVLHSLKLATEFLRPKGTFITKVFRSADYNSLLWVFHQLFGRVESTKPHSSRNASAEIFVVCRDYKAPDRIDPRLLDLKFVFKEAESAEGTGKGMAGGGGSDEVDVMHKKANKVRSREGYDDTLGVLLTRRVSVMDFLRCKDAVRALTDASGFDFDAQAEESGILSKPQTTDEIKTCCADLKLLGKKDFKLLLKWRLGMRHSIPALAGKTSRSENEDSEEEGDQDNIEGKEEEDEEAAMSKDLSAAAAAELRRRKREEKRKSKSKALSMKRNRLGMNMRSVDLLDTDDSLFNMARLRKIAASRGIDVDEVMDEIADHDLDDAEEDEEQEEEDEIVGEMGGVEDEEDDDGADIEGNAGTREAAAAVAAAGSGKLFDAMKSARKADTLDELEGQLDATYARVLANRAKASALTRQKAESGKKSHGIKMTRRHKLEEQALLTEAALNKKLDTEHTRYLSLLAGAKGVTPEAVIAAEKRKRAQDGASSDDDDEDEDADSVEDDAGDADASDLEEEDDDDDEGNDDDEDDMGAPVTATLPAQAARWFSRPEFGNSMASEQLTDGALGLKAGNKGKRSRQEVDAGSSDEEDGRHASSSASAMPVNPFKKRAGPKGGAQATDEAGNVITRDKDGDEFPDWMASVPKSDRDKRKEKLRKDRERAEKRAAAAAALVEEGEGQGFSTVTGPSAKEHVDDEFEAIAAAAAARYGKADRDSRMDDDGGDVDGDVKGLPESRKRQLIKAGLGAPARGAGKPTAGGDAFEVVPAEIASRKRRRNADDDSDDEDEGSSSDDSSPDPRLADYDSDEHAELLALGKSMKKHSTAKALLDASYNRYAFDDDANALPPWFSADERSHFRPTLPTSKAEVDAVKAKFRDIAARPVHKVAEARARKKRRLGVALDRAKAKASNIMDSEELGGRSKARAIAAAYRTANDQSQRKVVTQVNKKGKRVGSSGSGGRGAKTAVVDPRMKKEKRAAKRKDKHAKGKNAARRNKK